MSFGNGRTYHYNKNGVEWLQNPRELNPAQYQIFYDGRMFTGVAQILEFIGSDTYWHIVKESGRSYTYRKRELELGESCLNEKETQNKLV